MGGVNSKISPSGHDGTHLTTHLNSTTQLNSPPPVKSPVKILDARTRTQDFPKLSPLYISTYHLLISSLEKFYITCPSRSMVLLLWISECVWIHDSVTPWINTESDSGSIRPLHDTWDDGGRAGRRLKNTARWTRRQVWAGRRVM